MSHGNYRPNGGRGGIGRGRGVNGRGEHDNGPMGSNWKETGEKNGPSGDDVTDNDFSDPVKHSKQVNKAFPPNAPSLLPKGGRGAAFGITKHEADTRQELKLSIEFPLSKKTRVGMTLPYSLNNS